MTLNRESGFPSSANFFSLGSESLVKNFFKLPSGFNVSAPSAVLHMHHGASETVPIGVPGSSYSTHKNDDIFRSQGGHFMIFGNAPGQETVHIQSKSGAAIELSNDGSIKIVSGKGLHMSIGGDNQMVISGDLSINVAGSIKYKAGAVFFDVNDFTVNASGNYMVNVHNDHNLYVLGESHTRINSDKSETIGGSSLTNIAGFANEQVVGNKTIQTSGSVSVLSTGDQSLLAQGTLSMSSKGSATFNSQSTLGIVSVGAASIGSKQLSL